jgi:hypothetical protein
MAGSSSFRLMPGEENIFCWRKTKQNNRLESKCGTGTVHYEILMLFDFLRRGAVGIQLQSEAPRASRMLY